MRQIALLLLITICILTSCSKNEEADIKPPSVLRDISWNTNNSWPCRIYLEENGVPTPYLVLSDDYNGLCLLLREYLLDDDYVYNWGGEKPAYYENSKIDIFLNQEFYHHLAPQVLEHLTKTEIEITHRESLGIGGDHTCTIMRFIFLLSFTEVNAGASRTNLEEGQVLTYFSTAEQRIASYQNGEIGSWWLRTANTSGRTIVCGVGRDGVVGIGGIYDPNSKGGYYNGVRPAFCLPGDLPIEIIEINRKGSGFILKE